MTPAGRVDVIPLLLPLHRELLALLRSLRDPDWRRPTACPGWTVHDIAAHLLDGQLRRLSMGRDNWFGVQPAGELVDFLDRLNAEWVTAARRASPRVLISFLEVTGPELATHFAALDPDAPALFAVSWAGEETSANWMDIGREYTEHWHHQQQIRDAVGAPPLVSRRWLRPVLELFLRAVPHALPGASDGSIAIRISGDAGGDWVVRRGGRWLLYEGADDTADARVELSDDTAWRLWTRQPVRDRVRLSGNLALASAVANSLAVMARPRADAE
ncbi:MAG: maleylpyruvate isomerase N-terminal domain-containing protein [Bryobacteraceae bacterium]|nr:maleylpyruvate isomerase N-terminal domain-containing protein [Bryobacteraceae bacterium]